jgi:hypothetical protein
MAKQKATITLHPEKVDEARALVNARSTSAVVDIALDLLIRTERLRKDVAAYRQVPPTAEEIALAVVGAAAGIADDVDWEALYADGPA